MIERRALIATALAAGAVREACPLCGAYPRTSGERFYCASPECLPGEVRDVAIWAGKQLRGPDYTGEITDDGLRARVKQAIPLPGIDAVIDEEIASIRALERVCNAGWLIGLWEPQRRA